MSFSLEHQVQIQSINSMKILFHIAYQSRKTVQNIALYLINAWWEYYELSELNVHLLSVQYEELLYQE